jgi:hypothetical protein
LKETNEDMYEEVYGGVKGYYSKYKVLEKSIDILAM